MSAATTMRANAKAVISGLGGLVTVIGATASLAAYAPGPVAGTAGALLTVWEISRTAYVWLVRNEPMVENAAAAAGKVADAFGPHGEHWSVAPKPPET